MVQQRSVPMMIFLTIITCGIYNLYWFIVVTNEIESSLNQRDGSVSSGGMAFLFSIITCGIYMFYWYYRQGQRIAQLQREHNLHGNDNGVLYLILAIFGAGVGPIINMCLMQSDINAVAQIRQNGNYGGGQGGNGSYGDGGYKF